MPKSHSNPAHKAAAGFTLIEVLVALAIAALGLGALMAATSQGLGNQRAADAYIEATRRAQSRLATVGSELPVADGDWSGDDGGGFTWRVQTHPMQDADSKAKFIPYDVQVTIGWGGDGKSRTISLRSQRLGPHG